MLTNPNWEIHKNYVNSNVLTPTATNGIVSSIPYDYVITQEMLTWGTTNATTDYGIDIAKVLNKGDTPSSTTGMFAKKRISVMLDCATTASMALNFRNLTGTPWFDVGQGTNTLDIYSRAAFMFTGRNAPTYIHSGYGNLVYIPELPPDLTTSELYVGVFSCDSVFSWSGTFVYEAAQTSYVPEGSNVSRLPWMTNKLPVTSADLEGLLPELPNVFITYSSSFPENTNYAAVQEILGQGFSPVIKYEEGNDTFTYWYLTRITGCGFEFADVRNNKLHYLATWTYSGQTYCGWDYVDNYPLSTDEFVTVTFTYDLSSHTWTTTHTATQITWYISGGLKIRLKVEGIPSFPTTYLYDMEDFGSNTFRWRTMHMYENNPDNHDIDLFTFTLISDTVSSSITLIKSMV